MDTTIIASIIGAIATILAVILSWLLQNRKNSAGKQNGKQGRNYKPDKVDIYFMQYLLHDGYEDNRPFTATELAEHHMDYAPLEVELKLLNLEKHGFVKRNNRNRSGLGLWHILPKGIEFMFSGGHELKELIQEQKQSA